MDKVINANMVRACPECWHMCEKYRPCPDCGTPDPCKEREIVSAKDITTALIMGTLHVGLHGLIFEPVPYDIK